MSFEVTTQSSVLEVTVQDGSVIEIVTGGNVVSANPFDQDLNTDDDVTFNSVALPDGNVQTQIDDAQSTAEARQLSSEKGQANGYASLNASAQVVEPATDINLIPVPVSVVTGTPDTITFDCNSAYQKIFSTDSISNDVTVLLSNATNIRLISHHFRVTGTVVMTFGGGLNWVSGNTGWDDLNNQYTFEGGTNSLFEISIMKVTHGGTDYYKVKFSTEQI